RCLGRGVRHPAHPWVEDRRCAAGPGLVVGNPRGDLRAVRQRDGLRVQLLFCWPAEDRIAAAEEEQKGSTPARRRPATERRRRVEQDTAERAGRRPLGVRLAENKRSAVVLNGSLEAKVLRFAQIVVSTLEGRAAALELRANID